MTTTDNLKDHYSKILTDLGEDVTREGLVKTPLRAAKAMQDLTHGYKSNLDEIINGAIFTSDADQMILINDIEFYSLCEHHLLPFYGKCHIAYIPDKKVLGISKFARIVDHFSRRLQIQEGLTNQIAESIYASTGAKGVGVIIEAQHFCMMMRGVEKQHSNMKTSVMLGSFRESSVTRNEFLQLLAI
ncbi:MAG: GTP cyclohydrolase I FolE [Coxiella sp. (in: Bacteria)]|nr:MAG: GTP cyclohydrolase I FolE [Coxiella sp. (in: g-proteobacteria)]